MYTSNHGLASFLKRATNIKHQNPQANEHSVGTLFEALLAQSWKIHGDEIVKVIVKELMNWIDQNMSLEDFSSFTIELEYQQNKVFINFDGSNPQEVETTKLTATLDNLVKKYQEDRQKGIEERTMKEKEKERSRWRRNITFCCEALFIVYTCQKPYWLPKCLIYKNQSQCNGLAEAGIRMKIIFTHAVVSEKAKYTVEGPFGTSPKALILENYRLPAAKKWEEENLHLEPQQIIFHKQEYPIGAVATDLLLKRVVRTWIC